MSALAAEDVRDVSTGGAGHGPAPRAPLQLCYTLAGTERREGFWTVAAVTAVAEFYHLVGIATKIRKVW